MSSAAIRTCLAMTAISLLFGCNQKPAAPSKESQRMQAYLDPLPADPKSAVSTLVTRLMASVSRRGDLLVVRDQFLSGAADETDVMPISTPWTVHCGITGVSVTFGSSASPDGSDVEVTLSMAPITDASKCPQFGVMLGSVLENITGHT